MDKDKALKLAKKYIKSEPMPKGLRCAFLENSWDDSLSEVQELTAQYILENEGEPKGVKKAYPHANYQIEDGHGHMTYSVEHTDDYVQLLKAIMQ